MTQLVFVVCAKFLVTYVSKYRRFKWVWRS